MRPILSLSLPLSSSLRFPLSLSQPGDSYDRVKEGVVRTMMAGWLSGIGVDQLDQEQHKQWVNPNEVQVDTTHTLTTLP